jgi:hypothetical protein
VPEVSTLIVPRLVDFTATPVVQVDIHYTDPAHSIDVTDSFIFTDQKEQAWKVQVEPDSPKTFQVQVTYHLADGTVVQRDPLSLANNKITVPKYIPAA